MGNSAYFCREVQTTFSSDTFVGGEQNSPTFLTMGLFSSLFGSKPTTGSSLEEESEDLELQRQRNFVTLRDDGVRAMQMGEFRYAAQCLGAALEISHDEKVVGLLAEVYLRMNQPAEALPLIEEMVEEDEANFEIRLLLAQTQGQVALYADEQTTCLALLEQNPEEPRALFLLAEAEHGLDIDEKALTHLNLSLELRPEYCRARLLRATLLEQLERREEALDDVETLLDVDPDHEDYLLLRAKILMGLSRFDEAIADYEHVRAVNPFGHEAVLNLGALYEQMANFPKALSLYDEAVDLQPEFAPVYKARGTLRAQLNDAVGAAQDFQRMRELTHDAEEAEQEGFTTAQNQINARYRNMNPFGF